MPDDYELTKKGQQIAAMLMAEIWEEYCNAASEELHELILCFPELFAQHELTPEELDNDRYSEYVEGDWIFTLTDLGKLIYDKGVKARSEVRK